VKTGPLMSTVSPLLLTAVQNLKYSMPQAHENAVAQAIDPSN